MPITRLAPSPTGAFHLGNARTFLANWLLARQNHWRILLRIEDLDGPRVKMGADQQAIDDLSWLGIDWDQGPFYQSSRLPMYQAAIRRLIDSRRAYPCVCTRSEVNSAASAPHAEDGAAIYPETCRGRFDNPQQAAAAAGREPAIRFLVPDGIVPFTDAFCGQQQFEPRRQLGDFVIAKADGTPAYQLAVVVDDAQMQVSHIVRADDLIDSTPRQILLYEALGLREQLPSHCHLPLVVGPDGRRLAKRHGDTRLASYRQQGVPAGRVLSLLARWCGISLAHEPKAASDLVGRFDLSAMSRQAIVFRDEDDRWLKGP
jgi:glutamyl-tRNA synthetase